MPYSLDISIRENALRTLKTHYEGQKFRVPAADPYDFKWDTVIRQQLGERERRMDRALAIIEGPEEKVPGLAFQQCTLSITLEWRAMLAVREDPTEAANCILWNLQRRLRESLNLATTAYPDGAPGVVEVREVGNELDIATFEDRQVGGAVFAILRYKHAENDPRVVVGAGT